METAQEVAGYEPEEDENVTATVIKRVLKELMDDLKDSVSASARRELAALKAQDEAIKDIESVLETAGQT